MRIKETHCKVRPTKQRRTTEITIDTLVTHPTQECGRIKQQVKTKESERERERERHRERQREETEPP